MELLSRTCSYERMNTERIVARLFVVLGGIFWVFMLFGAGTGSGYRLGPVSGSDVSSALGTAAIPLAFTIIVFVLGLFYERLTALLLVLASLAVVIYGLIAVWESGVWLFAISVLVAPMLIAAALFWMAGRMEQICKMEQQHTG
jgi:hypothetical protein